MPYMELVIFESSLVLLVSRLIFFSFKFCRYVEIEQFILAVYLFAVFLYFAVIVVEQSADFCHCFLHDSAFGYQVSHTALNISLSLAILPNLKLKIRGYRRRSERGNRQKGVMSDRMAQTGDRGKDLFFVLFMPVFIVVARQGSSKVELSTAFFGLFLNFFCTFVEVTRTSGEVRPGLLG